MTKEIANDVCALMHRMDLLRTDIEVLTEALNSHKGLHVSDMSGFFHVPLEPNNISQLIESKREDLKDVESELESL